MTILWMIALLLLFAPQGQDTPEPDQPASGWIAVTVAAPEATQVLLVDPDNAEAEALPLVACAVNCMHLQWSADGQRLGYLDGDFVVVVDLSGDEIARAEVDRGTYAFNVHPDWTDDLSQATFTARYNAENALVVVTLADETITRFDAVAEDASHPHWLPDNRRVGFSAGESLYIIDTETGEQDRVTQIFDSHDLPVWSPDGSQIALRVRVGGAMAQAVMEADESDGYAILNAIVETPTWSPDGQYVASLAWTEDGSGEIHLAIIDVADPGNTVIVAKDAATRLPPSWAAGGERLAYLSQRVTPRGIAYDLSLVPADGSADPVVLLADVAGPSSIATSPAWQPVDQSD